MTNQPIEEKCEYCKAWESETGYGKECKHDAPIEEKWKTFDERFVSEDVTGSECWSISGRAVWEVKSFIENLLEQERIKEEPTTPEKKCEHKNVYVATSEVSGEYINMCRLCHQIIESI